MPWPQIGLWCAGFINILLIGVQGRNLNTGNYLIVGSASATGISAHLAVASRHPIAAINSYDCRRTCAVSDEILARSGHRQKTPLRPSSQLGRPPDGQKPLAPVLP
jgi:hypothetical protein